MKKKISIVSCLLLAVTTLSAQFVLNPQFEVARPTSATYTYYNPQIHKDPAGINSQALNWDVWNDYETPGGGLITELVKAGSNCVPPWPNYVMGNMMHVKTTKGLSGISNTEISAGTNKVKVTCWVYVIKGTVVFGYGPTGNSIYKVSSKSTCRWEKLEIIKSKDEACNQITLYSSVSADAEFYVDAVSVVKM